MGNDIPVTQRQVAQVAKELLDLITRWQSVGDRNRKADAYARYLNYCGGTGRIEALCQAVLRAHKRPTTSPTPPEQSP